MNPAEIYPLAADSRGSGRSIPRPGPGLAEHDRHVGPANLEFDESVGDHRRSDPVEFEDARVTVLDDDGRPGLGGELGQGIAQRAPDQARHQVDEGFPFHRRHKRSVDADPTVPVGQGLLDRGHLLVDEPVGVLLVGVDDDLQLTDAGVPGWSAAFAWHTSHCAPYCIACSHYPEAPVE